MRMSAVQIILTLKMRRGALPENRPGFMEKVGAF